MIPIARNQPYTAMLADCEKECAKLTEQRNQALSDLDRLRAAVLLFKDGRNSGFGKQCPFCLNEISYGALGAGRELQHAETCPVASAETIKP